MTTLIPEHDPYDPHPYPGDIQPGEYDVAELLRAHADNREVILFIADMLEE